MTSLQSRNATGNATGNTTDMNNTAQQAARVQAIFEDINQHLWHDFIWALLFVIGIAFVYRCIKSLCERLRLVACLNSDTQHYFAIPTRWWSHIKYNLQYAPLTRSRYRASWIMGQVPTRFQALFLVTIIATNIYLCFYDVPYRDPELELLAILRARTGTMAVVNLVPVTIMATVKNPLINLLDISYDSFNIMHRWFGRVAIIEAAIHTTCHISSVVRNRGWSAFVKSTSDPMIWTGLVAILAAIIILIQSPSIIRQAFYEAFLHFHVTLAALFLAFLWMHLDGFPQWYLILTTVIIWATARVLRLSTLIYRSVGQNSCSATVEALPRDAVRVTMTTPRPWIYVPGQYVYLTIPSIGLWTAHPFSIAWSNIAPPPNARQSSTNSQLHTFHDIEKVVETNELTGQQSFSLVIRARNGFTKRLLSHTIKHAPAYLGHRVPMKVLLEGPYGLSRSLDSYGTVLLIAGGVGITHHLGYVRHLIQGYNEGTVATRKVTLIWSIRRESEKECVGPWMNEILAMEGRREVLRLEIYVTRGFVQESRSPSNSVFVRKGRPDLGAIVKREAQRRLGCMGVSVCGPGGLQDDARAAVRREIKDRRNVEFTEEAFGC